MSLETRSTDAKGRISLPKGFANSTVIIEQVSENEFAIRKARVISEDELHFAEELPIVLSDRERERFLQSARSAAAAERRLASSDGREG